MSLPYVSFLSYGQLEIPKYYLKIGTEPFTKVNLYSNKRKASSGLYKNIRPLRIYWKKPSKKRKILPKSNTTFIVESSHRISLVFSIMCILMKLSFLPQIITVRKYRIYIHSWTNCLIRSLYVSWYLINRFIDLLTGIETPYPGTFLSPHIYKQCHKYIFGDVMILHGYEFCSHGCHKLRLQLIINIDGIRAILFKDNVLTPCFVPSGTLLCE